MRVVVADSSPLNYLVLIESIDLLPRLYAEVLVPQQVVSELVDPAAPPKVRHWAERLPTWVDVRIVQVLLITTAVNAGHNFTYRAHHRLGSLHGKTVPTVGDQHLTSAT